MGTVSESVCSSIEEDDIVSSEKQSKHPLTIRILHKIEDLLDDVNWVHVAFRICAFAYIAFMAWITWHVLPVPGHWDNGRHSDKVPLVYQDLNNYFGSFDGNSECIVRINDLYKTPPRDDQGNYFPKTFCPSRRALLEAMSGGGRHGFDAPYAPKGCHYRWYTNMEICMILERFNSLIFIGDDFLQTIYAGLNILLREDLANGALQTWSMDAEAKQECRCNSQFIKEDCRSKLITSSKQVSKNLDRKAGSYVCQRTPHTFIHIDGSNNDPSNPAIQEFKRLIPPAPRSKYQPIPIIHSLSPYKAAVAVAGTSHTTARDSLLSTLKLADDSKRRTPLLWIGPTAAGHIEMKGRKGNQEIWDFDRAMARVAVDNDIDVLGM